MWITFFMSVWLIFKSRTNTFWSSRRPDSKTKRAIRMAEREQRRRLMKRLTRGGYCALLMKSSNPGHVCCVTRVLSQRANIKVRVANALPQLWLTDWDENSFATRWDVYWIENSCAILIEMTDLVTKMKNFFFN